MKREKSVLTAGPSAIGHHTCNKQGRNEFYVVFTLTDNDKHKIYTFTRGRFINNTLIISIYISYTINIYKTLIVIMIMIIKTYFNYKQVMTSNTCK